MGIEYNRVGKSKIFKIDFDIQEYRDIVPDYKVYQETDQILNVSDWQKGNLDNCFWQKHTPTKAEISSMEWKAIEAKRCLKSGVFVAIREEVLWVPPSYYTALQYGKVGEVDLQFRLKRLKHVYHKIRARNNPYIKGSLTIKNRADGETTQAMSDGLWECADGNMLVGQVGIQSKTNNDSKNPCWSTIQILWQSYPQWLKEILFPDFASGSNIAEKMMFLRDMYEERGVAARNVRIQYYPSVFNAMDGKHNMKICILDEVCKYRECEFYDVFTNYSKFIMPGFERRGMFDMFSSPSDVACKSNEQVYELWKESNMDELDERGATRSGVFRYFSTPLEGVQGAYDKYGDADPQQIYDWIVKTRKTVPKDKLMGEIRGFPLNEEEAFGSFDSGSVWTNIDGIKKRSIYLIGTRFKDEKTQEPINVYGNLERVDGYIDGEVEFRPTDRGTFDLKDARFCFSYLPKNKEPLKSIFKPPLYVENSLGLDPFNNRYEAKNVVKQSNGAMINRKFRDIHNTGVKGVPTMIYCCRPSHVEILFEDCLKAAIYNRALIQYESRSDKFANYAEDRGYSAWLLPEIGASSSSHRKGDSPSGGKNSFLNEGIGLIDANTNLPLNEDDPYYLEQHWFELLLNQYIGFNPLDTHKSDCVMADIQSLVGCVKIMHKNIKKPSKMNDAVLNFLLS
jgi:hypothetical protein